MSSAISRKHCRHKFKLYCLRCAPKRPQRSHFLEAIPVLRSFGLLNLVNFAKTAGLLFNWRAILLQSLAVNLTLPLEFLKDVLDKLILLGCKILQLSEPCLFGVWE